MQPLQDYSQMTLQLHDPANAGALINIAEQRLINDGIKASLGVMQVSGATGDHHGDSKSVSISIPGVRAATGKNRTVVQAIHFEGPEGIDIEFGTEAVYTPDEVAANDTDVTGGLTDPKRLGFLTPKSAIEIPHDPVNEVGILKFQAKKTGVQVIPPRSYVQDRGNAMRAIIALYVPYTEGTISGYAAETAEESSNSGQTHLLLRPAGSSSSFFQVGCHQNEITEAFQYEYSQVMKGYSDTILSDALRKRLSNFTLSLTARTEKLSRLIRSGVYEETDYGKIVVPSSNSLVQKFECYLRTITPRGAVIYIRLPECGLKPNGDWAHGGANPAYPITVEGYQPAEELFWQNLYQVVFFSLGIEIIA
jgi:hypothetical protein